MCTLTLKEVIPPMRLRRKQGITDKLNMMNQLVLQNPHQYRGEWKQLFGNDNPLQLELGTGKGGFIHGLAKQSPQNNYIGIERVPDILYIAACKLEGEKLPNVRLLMVDAEYLLDIFAPGEVTRLYLNFSDPWPKAKHAKRRLTHPDFLGLYRRLLAPGGEIHLKTDNLDLFEYSLLSLAQEGFSLQHITYDLHNSSVTDNIMTEYEKRFSDLDQPIYRLEALSPLI